MSGTQSPPWTPQNLPAEICKLKQWVTWRYSYRKNKWSKPPDQESNAPHRWMTAWEAWQLYLDGIQEGCTGIGFVFTQSDPFVGIDLDHCFDPTTGEISKLAYHILSEVDSYCEISPSGTGVKVIARGKLPAGRRSKKFDDGTSIEMYDRGRYFTATGWRVPAVWWAPGLRARIIWPHKETPPPRTDVISSLVEYRPDQIVAMHRDHVQGREAAAQQKAKTTGRHPGRVTSEPPEELLRGANRSRKVLISALWSLGSDYFDDYRNWVSVGMALHASREGDLFEAWDAWSAQSALYTPGEPAEKWAGFKKPKEGENALRPGSVIAWARAGGWKDPSKPDLPKRPKRRKKTAK